MMEVAGNHPGVKLKQADEFVEAEEMRQAMRRWVTGVTVVTSRHAGVRHGMTVSSFTSITLIPPRLLVSLQVHTRTHELVKQSGVFGVTLLSQAQQDISDRFAGRIPEYEDRFLGLETFTLATGAPILTGGVAGFDCEVLAAYAVGDHTLFVGDVLAVQISQDAHPLVYYNRGYWRLDI
jgi:flavin reductase (DIM6/NTAB) family NADH-FMN oxidoreductase RutF